MAFKSTVILFTVLILIGLSPLEKGMSSCKRDNYFKDLSLFVLLLKLVVVCFSPFSPSF